MTDFIDGLERDLVDAARRRRDAAAAAGRQRRGVPLRGMLLAAALFVLAAGSAAGGTLLVLRGSAIPVPRDVPPEQTPEPGSAHVSDLRVRDPQPGAPPWTLRIARSRTGLVCSTVGQIVDGQFGLVGLDHRFRSFDEGVSDSCGAERHGAASLVGARVFDSGNLRDVRTVVSGVGGDSLRRVRLSLASGRRINVPIGAGGVFVAVLRGYPEDLGVTATLVSANGRREVHPFGVSPFVVPDPAGGRAWRVFAGAMSGDARTCVSFAPARQRPHGPRSPSACGDLGTGRHQRGWFFAVRRITPGTGGPPFDPVDNRGDWGSHPPRTAVWGNVGEDVRSVAVRLGTGVVHRPAIRPARFFLVMFGPHADPRDVTVTLRLRNGRTVVRHGSDGLVDHPIRRGRTP
jgi:hypothetical protein